MKAGLIRTAAVASLVMLGAGTMDAQSQAGVSRPDPRAEAGALSERVVQLGLKAPAPRTVRKDRLQQAASEWKRSIDYSGPRFGFTYLPQEVVDSLKAHNIDVGSTISQFGWQFEHEIQVNGGGPMVLNEWVFLAGGLEKGVFLPSLTWLVGARGTSGNEVGFGPNVSLAGVGLALAAGVTVHNGDLNIPMNVAAASSRGGIRVSFLTGFTLH